MELEHKLNIAVAYYGKPKSVVALKIFKLHPGTLQNYAGRPENAPPDSVKKITAWADNQLLKLSTELYKMRKQGELL